MDSDLFDEHSDCSSELSETRSELEARIYSIIHHNDFSGTSESPFIDPKYGVEFNSNGEIVVFQKDPADIVINTPITLSEVCTNKVIPTITLDDDDLETSKDISSIIDYEFAETSLKKKKKKKKKKKNVNDESIEEYINTIKNTDALKEYKEKSGFNKMNTKTSKSDNVALNVVSFNNERAMPMTSSEILKQYRIGKPTENSLWYRCPKTWTPDMIKFYTKIQKSKRNYDCKEVLNKIKEKYGSNPIDWSLDPMDLYKSNSNTPRMRCSICRQFGHTGYNCKDQYKPPICIMCGMEGHHFHSCNKKICLSCGTWQKNFTNNCSICLSMIKVKCNMCNDVGHESSYCTETWRRFHSTISTAPEPESNKFAQSTSRSNTESRQSSTSKSESSSTLLSPIVKQISKNSPKSVDSGKSKKAKRLQSKIKHSKTKNQSNLSTSDNESINIDVNIQDVTLKRTLTKRNFFKKKKLNVNS
uniref:Zinc finger CCHC domain-containing protein 7 n=1 Tax=Schizaphis graminum TaxID=13262 RepID=A0A2S2P5W0_SCHGA